MGQHDAPGLSRPAHATYSQTRVVHPNCFRSDQNRIYAAAKLACMLPGRRSCNPARFIRRARQPTVKRHAAFCDDERLAAHYPFVESLVQARAVLRQDALSHFDACIAQPRDASSVMARIHVHRAHNYFPDSSPKNRIGAGGGEPNCGTGLECNVERCTSGHVGAEVAQTLDLRVIMPRSSVMSSCHYPIANHQHCADSGIGACLALCLFGFL